MAAPHGGLGVGIGRPQVADVGADSDHRCAEQQQRAKYPLLERAFAHRRHEVGYRNRQHRNRRVVGDLKVVGLDAQPRGQRRHEESKCGAAAVGEEHPEHQRSHVGRRANLGVVPSRQRNDKEGAEPKGHGTGHAQPRVDFFAAKQKEESEHEQGDDVYTR